MKNRSSQSARLRWAAVVGLFGMGLVAAAPAAADPAPAYCAQSSFNLGVQFVGIQSAQNLPLLQQLDGSFVGEVKARVFCSDQQGTDLGEVPGVVFQITTTVPNTTVNGMPATNTPVSISAPTGITMLTIRSTDPGLKPTDWSANVGRDTISITQAFGQAVSPNSSPIQIGNLFARTPELDSLVLFGTGILGGGGYLLTRLRAARRPR